jgi:RHH-type rel operon transcriptional repressor/antitoxin RelB
VDFNFMLAIRLPESVEKRLERLARRTGRTKTFYVREALIRYLEDLEDLYDAHEVSERVRRGEERTYSLKEVVRDLGLDKPKVAHRARRNGKASARKAG